MLIIIPYVDDMLLTGNNEEKIADFKAQHMCGMGMLHYYLGIQFVQNKHGIIMSQSKYVQKLLVRFKMKDCKPISTSMAPGLKLSLYDSSEPIDATIYNQPVGCLIYLCNTRPSIQYIVSQVSRYMHNPKTSHW